MKLDDPNRPHIVGGKFQSDKYPTCPAGKVPLSVEDPMAWDLLWEYAQRRRTVDSQFADDLEWALKNAGYEPTRLALAPTGVTALVLRQLEENSERLARTMDKAEALIARVDTAERENESMATALQGFYGLDAKLVAATGRADRLRETLERISKVDVSNQARATHAGTVLALQKLAEEALGPTRIDLKDPNDPPEVAIEGVLIEHDLFGADSLFGPVGQEMTILSCRPGLYWMPELHVWVFTWGEKDGGLHICQSSHDGVTWGKHDFDRPYEVVPCMPAKPTA